jgi:hypothetical protein
VKPSKLIIIWAGNLDFDLICKVRSHFKALDPKAQIFVRNADVYSGPGDLEKCDGVFVAPRYRRIAQDFRAAGVTVMMELGESNEGSIPGCGEGNERDQHDRRNPENPGSEDPDLAGIPAVETGATDHRLGFADSQSQQPRRRGRPRGSTKIRKQE